MSIKQTREFCPGDRYRYDCGLCSTKNGFAQIDTSQDAHYYGTWANPEKRLIFSYTEGDTCLTECDTDQEFIEQIRYCETWNNDGGWGQIHIDPGFNPDIKQRFEAMGLADLLH